MSSQAQSCQVFSIARGKGEGRDLVRFARQRQLLAGSTKERLAWSDGGPPRRRCSSSGVESRSGGGGNAPAYVLGEDSFRHRLPLPPRGKRKLRTPRSRRAGREGKRLLSHPAARRWKKIRNCCMNSEIINGGKPRRDLKGKPLAPLQKKGRLPCRIGNAKPPRDVGRSRSSWGRGREGPGHLDHKNGILSWGVPMFTGRRKSLSMPVDRKKNCASDRVRSWASRARVDERATERRMRGP